MSYNRTTKHHFEVFRAEVYRLVKLWGVVDLDVRVSHDDVGDALATFQPDATTRVCVIRLGTKWGPHDHPSDEAVRKSARHEVAHLVTAELIVMARARCVTDDELTSAIEVTARRLERMLPR